MSRRYQPLNSLHAESIAIHASRMRHVPTTSERLLWAKLSGSALGVPFRQQFVIGRFIADFAAPSVRIAVEVDGAYHAMRCRADEARDKKFHCLGWRVLHIPAETILRSLPSAVAVIREALAGDLPQSTEPRVSR